MPTVSRSLEPLGRARPCQTVWHSEQLRDGTARRWASWVSSSSENYAIPESDTVETSGRTAATVCLKLRKRVVMVGGEEAAGTGRGVGQGPGAASRGVRWGRGTRVPSSAELGVTTLGEILNHERDIYAHLLFY